MHCVITGGAGFIGSYFVDRLLSDPTTEKVIIYDNFSSGRKWHYQHHLADKRLEVIKGHIENTLYLEQIVKGANFVIHLASNPDISRAVTEPCIDFWQGTALTNSVLEAMRETGVKRLLYASGSGVYGDLGLVNGKENRGSLMPISTYGASKLAGEVLINSYCKMFGLTACAFRFGNVVGARQTHGVCFDFIKQLLKNPNELKIMGDGSQSKSYIHVEDVVDAVMLANEKLKIDFDIYNVATGDYITVKEIAELVAECMRLNNVEFKYTGGDRGWKGDVPVVRLNTTKIKKIGWKCKMKTREALRVSIVDMIENIKSGKM